MKTLSTATSLANFQFDHMTAWYIFFVAYVCKFNAILLRSMKSREDASMIEAFTSIYAELEAIGHSTSWTMNAPALSKTS